MVPLAKVVSGILLRVTRTAFGSGGSAGDIGLHAELFAGRLARPSDDHAVIAVQLPQKP